MGTNNTTPPSGVSLNTGRNPRNPARHLFIIVAIFLVAVASVLIWGFANRARASAAEKRDNLVRKIAGEPARNIRQQIQQQVPLAEEQKPITTRPEIAWQPAGQQMAAQGPPPQYKPEIPEEWKLEEERKKADYAFLIEQRESGGLHHTSSAGNPQQRAVLPRSALAPAQPAISKADAAGFPPSLKAFLAAASGKQPRQDPPIPEDAEAQRQAEQAQFAKPPETPATDDYLKAGMTAPRSRWEIQQGSNIPAITIETINSDLPGDLSATVTRSVYDAQCNQAGPDGVPHCYILIPAGTKLIGQYDAHVAYAQSRAQVIWHRMIFPNTWYIDLGAMAAHSPDGSAGLHDQTDNHVTRLAAGVLLTSLLSAGFQLSQNRANGNNTFTYPSDGRIIASAVGQESSRLGQQITGRNLSISPTLKIRGGQQFDVYVNKDVVFGGFWILTPGNTLEFVKVDQ